MNCETQILYCDSSPCQNGQQCLDGINSYNCNCQGMYYGTHCENADPCIVRPCQNGGNCLVTGNTRRCACTPGTTGVDCSIVEPCDPNPCLFNGVCQPKIDSNGITLPDYECICQPSQTGRFCELAVDLCASGPCLLDENCFMTLDFRSYKCEKCKNSGVWDPLNGICNCPYPDAYIGSRCEIDKLQAKQAMCISNTCLKGDCDIRYNQNTQALEKFCVCYPNYKGPNCDIPIFDPCATSTTTCQNGATCINLQTNGVWTAVCQCQAGYAGPNCQDDVDECAIVTCDAANTDSCDNVVGSYFCHCKPGFNGKNCENDIDECYLGYCKNGAACINMPGSFQCICPPEFQPPTCDRYVNHCDSGPLQGLIQS